MAEEPLNPLEIPDDTTKAGLAGWMLESVARSYALRLAALVALLGATIAALSPDAPAGPRIAMVVVGVATAFALLASQLGSWRRSRQWGLIVVTGLVSLALLVTVVRLG
ncbi:hypothetical protein EUA93_09200 [Nocardioides oleivorans]|uniref:DUF202 domain-containing protein n=1 Tax=Nocardioides oleivorans TaxID=273676 RepID=A0A4Q2S321_9ACTN|nr:hypothetical protein [Nocardioides oleivorans]RYB94503.1 hypothetical protein EUA93_09200 [Nocardioides oleivorans]